MNRFVFVMLIVMGLLFAEGEVMADKVVVKKSARMLYLLNNEDVFKKYHITLGQVPLGDKEFEGDMKTPEGVYRIDYRQYSEDYYKSLHISYP
ncbi:MAG TPA: hypothetical protein ENK82_09835, partial [Campylobacterales bacterium]|nr:hypothetical protein [Campylobacterales bacterium]